MSRISVFRRHRGALLIVAMLTVPATIATARQFSPSSTSPATGHAQVITQGISKLPVWRVVQRTAQPRWKAKVGRRALGFVLASDEPVLLSNVVIGEEPVDVALLGNGESLLVQNGTRQIRASMTDQPIEYFTLEIVSASSADDAGNGAVLFISEPFTAPTGQRDIDLVRNVLRLNESASLPDTGTPVHRFTFWLLTERSISSPPLAKSQRYRLVKLGCSTDHSRSTRLNRLPKARDRSPRSGSLRRSCRTPIPARGM